MKPINEFINTFVSMVEKPFAINNKQGFVLKNGMRILFRDSKLSDPSKEQLKRHYAKK